MRRIVLAQLVAVVALVASVLLGGVLGLRRYYGAGDSGLEVGRGAAAAPPFAFHFTFK